MGDSRHFEGEIRKRAKTDKSPKASMSLNTTKLAALLSNPPWNHAGLLDFERWVEAVEREPNQVLRIVATQAWVVYHEEADPVSSRFYRIVGGTPPPGTNYYIGETLTFIAYAAASGVVGNLAYDLVKRIVQSFLSPASQVTFEEKVSFEEYETVRKELHKEDARNDTLTTSNVEKEIGLKHRLLIERKWTKK